MYQRTKIILDWSTAVAIYVITLLIIPISNKLFSGLSSNTANPFLNSIINLVILAVFVSLPVFLIYKGRKPAASSYIWLAVIFIISIFFLMRVELVKDRLHFVGYGVLSFFLYRAMRHNVGTNLLYIWNCLLIMLFAILDETFQLFGVGGRGFEFKDIGTDWLSGLMGQALIALVVRPKLETVEIKIRKYAKGLRQAGLFRIKRRPESGDIDIEKLSRQIYLAFKNTAEQGGGHVHFMYRGKKDHLVMVCHEQREGQIIAKDSNCGKGEYIPWDKSEFSRFSAKQAFLKFIPQIESIIIDHPSIQKSWDSFDEFQDWLNKIA